jgi:putative tryptophan/tyrosine transport system substrate-binding protein
MMTAGFDQRGRQMKRRKLVAMIGVAAAGTVARAAGTRAQSSSKPIVGFLADGTPEGFAPRLAGVKRGLAAAGFAEGSVVIEPRWARGNYELLPQFAGELAAAKVAVIVTAGSEKVMRAAMAATQSIPIVATMAGDPVKRGVVSSISRPGGNITVVSLFTSSRNALVSKRVELLHEVAPNAKILGWLVDANILDFDDQREDLQSAARALGLEINVAQVARPNAVEEAFRSVIRSGAGALLQTGPVFYADRALLLGLAAQNSIPVLYEWRDMVDAGGLMSYGTDLGSIFQQCGTYAARIIKGAKVGDLPVVQEPRIELVVNLKTAHTLGLTVPPSLLARADTVIE